MSPGKKAEKDAGGKTPQASTTATPTAGLNIPPQVPHNTFGATPTANNAQRREGVPQQTASNGATPQVPGQGPGQGQGQNQAPRQGTQGTAQAPPGYSPFQWTMPPSYTTGGHQPNPRTSSVPIRSLTYNLSSPVRVVGHCNAVKQTNMSNLMRTSLLGVTGALPDYLKTHTPIDLTVNYSAPVHIMGGLNSVSESPPMTPEERTAYESATMRSVQQHAKRQRSRSSTSEAKESPEVKKRCSDKSGR
ncbi:MAG: hypothetical protein M4579_005569 [Chaenotheca gracillima]|nr:MAG: hypothetical protein M4579_005569 [Chaenotheca gracillima]